jgi:aminoglycoside phosphotransferase family enzyme
MSMPLAYGPMSDDLRGLQEDLPLDAKVAFLRNPRSYGAPVRDVAVRETRMSWVFLAGGLVYKLKKPLRSDVLDFSTLARREAACLAELHLNRRLAPHTYLDVKPLSLTENGLSIGGARRVVDWLVVMRRLDEHRMLDATIREGRLAPRDLDRLAKALADFYRHARHVPGVPVQHIREWKRTVASSWRALLDPALCLPGGAIQRVGHRLTRFVAEHLNLLMQRDHAGYLVDAHGDLRPEHIWLGEPLQIIDCLEFNSRLRALDPLSEICLPRSRMRKAGRTLGRPSHQARCVQPNTATQERSAVPLLSGPPCDGARASPSHISSRQIHERRRNGDRRRCPI